MKVDGRSGVQLIGGSVDYVDGSEDRILEVLEAAGDVATGSDELAVSITDWPSRYHLSRLRSNLLRPLAIQPGMRVFDVGAGTGTLTRYVAEIGADVVALEGTLARARAVATRCEGLANVRVLCGSVAELDDAEGFDLVLCVGVLEYSGTEARRFLGRLRSLTRPGGSLVVAIENQLGLKYLLGYGEDHTGDPWLGVEGYPETPRTRTFSRRTLGALLRDAGFPAQRWTYPFPDYKLPRVVLDSSAYAGPGAESFVDQIVRWPCSPDASPPLRLCDDRRAHQAFLEAGLGPDVANSFLVVASSDPEAPGQLVDPATRAWFFGGDRMKGWLRAKTFGATGRPSSVVARAVHPDARLRARGWLTQAEESDQDLVEGRTIEQLVLAGCMVGPDEMSVGLQQWSRHIDSISTAVDDAAAIDHPFRTPETVALLSADHLDVNLSNFVVDGDGAMHFVDAEWVAPSGVDRDLVCVRALWWFAADVVTRGVSHPWPSSTTVNELTERLGLLCGRAVGGDTLERWFDSEALLQEKVTGQPAEEFRRWLGEVGAQNQLAPAVLRHVPFRALRRSVHVANEQSVALYGQVTSLTRLAADVNVRLTEVHDHLSGLLQAQGAELAEERAELGAARAAGAALAVELEAERRRWETFHARRFDRRLKRLVRRLLTR